jgi:hypothetical protein
MRSLRTLDWKWETDNSFSGMDMAFLLDWVGTVPMLRNCTNLTRMLVRYVNAWQQPYGVPGPGLAVEN